MKRITALFVCLGTCGLSGQSISYNSFDFGSGQPVATLKDVTSVGANDRTVATGLLAPGLPAWSRDGMTLALTSPGPNEVSQDIHLMDGTTGAVRKLYNFSDYADADGAHWEIPLAKAFSPDGALLATSVLLKTSVVNSGVTTLPRLILFNTSGQDPPVLLAPTNLWDGGNIEGLGCAWSSTNQIAWPATGGKQAFYNNAPFGLANGSCIYILQPNVNNPQPRQLTGGEVRYLQDSVVTQRKSELDYAPAFSPNGNFVAYVRVTRTVQNLVSLPDQCSIRVVNINGTGDAEILRINPGFWISQLSWSPDGNLLLFDLGPQVVAGGVHFEQAVPASVEIHGLNMNTLVPGLVHAAPAVWPAWRPVASALAIRAVPGTNSIELTWPVGSALSRLRSSPNPGGAWGNVTTAPVVGNWVNKVTLTRSAPKMFFRLESP